MKEYWCEKIYDSKYSKVKETIGSIVIGAFGAMTDSKAEKYKICIDEAEGSLSIIGIGHSAWGGVEEVKENEKEYLKISEVTYSIENSIIKLENSGRVREFQIIE